MNNKNEISRIKRYRSNIEIFIDDKDGDTLFHKTYYSDSFEKRSHLPTIKEIKEDLGLTYARAKELKSELESWMSGIRNDWQ